MNNNYPRFTLGEELTKEQIRFFDENGFLHFKNFIKPEAVQQIINASLEVQKKWITEDVKKVNGVPIKYGVDVNGETIVQRFAFLNQHSPVLEELIKDPRMATLFALLGEGARVGENEKDGMVFNHYVNVEGGSFTKMGWHTDSPRDLFYGKKILPMLNVGIHLSDAIEGDGGLRVLPGTHNKGLLSMLFRKKQFVDNNPDPNEVQIVTSSGDLTIHDGRLWHRVAPSSTKGEASRRRVIYVPIITGKYAPKDENSKTQLYQRLAGFVK